MADFFFTTQRDAPVSNFFGRQPGGTFKASEQCQIGDLTWWDQSNACFRSAAVFADTGNGPTQIAFAAVFTGIANSKQRSTDTVAAPANLTVEQIGEYPCVSNTFNPGDMVTIAYAAGPQAQLIDKTTDPTKAIGTVVLYYGTATTSVKVKLKSKFLTGYPASGAGAGSFTSLVGTSSNLTITGQVGSASAGGQVSVAGGAGAGSGNAGGAVSMTAGSGATTGAGGTATLAGGASIAGATGAGGAALVTGGASGATNDVGGSASLIGGAGAGTGLGGAAIVTGGLGGATNAVGGAVTITAGAGQGTGAGAAASMTGGASGAGATGAGGAVTVTGGAAASTNGAGGAATVTGGAGVGTGNGGAVSLVSGAAGATGVAGAIAITVGAATAGIGSAITLTAGNGAGSTNGGGAINLIPGTAVSTGTPGEVQVNSAAGLFSASWQQFVAANVPVTGTSYPFFIADRAYRVKSAHCICSSTSTVPTVDITKDTGTTAPGAGTSVMTGAMTFSATANTLVTGTISSTVATITLAAGDRLSTKWGGTVGSITGAMVSVLLVPC